MATWEELTDDQRARFSAWMTQLLRPVSGELARVLYHLDVTKEAYTATAADVYALLDTDAMIPNEGGLAGAVALTKAEMTPMLAALSALLTDYYADEDLQRYIKLAGAPNVLGS